MPFVVKGFRTCMMPSALHPSIIQPRPLLRRRRRYDPGPASRIFFHVTPTTFQTVYKRQLSWKEVKELEIDMIDR